MPPALPGVLLIVTRPAPQAQAWVLALRQLGVAAAALPLIGIEPPADPAAVQATWLDLARYDLAMFVSAHAVARFMAAAPAGMRWPANLRAAATGPGTAKALLDAGVATARLTQPAADAAKFDSEALWSLLAADDWIGRRVLIVRGEHGRNWLGERFLAHGAQVDFTVAYRRTLPQPDAEGQVLLRAARAEPAACVWLFSSSEAVANLQRIDPGADRQAASAAATHPRIAQAARAAGFGRVYRIAPTLQAVAAWHQSER